MPLAPAFRVEYFLALRVEYERQYPAHERSSRRGERKRPGPAGQSGRGWTGGSATRIQEKGGVTRRAGRQDGRRDEAIDTNPITPPNTITPTLNPTSPRTCPMYSVFPHVVSRIAGSGVPSSESCNKPKAKARDTYSAWRAQQARRPLRALSWPVDGPTRRRELHVGWLFI